MTPTPPATTGAQGELTGLKVVKRSGDQVTFEPVRIERAIAAAFRAELGLSSEAQLDPAQSAEIARLTEAVSSEVLFEAREGKPV